MLPDEQDGIAVTKPAYSQGGSVLRLGVPISTHPEADDIRPHSPSSRTATNSQKTCNAVTKSSEAVSRLT